MTVLVTGATGFVGRHLVERLCRDGVRVRALVRERGAASLPEESGLEITAGDLTNPPSLEDAVRGCDLVYHLAAAHGPQASQAECMRVNIDGTRHLAEAAARAGVGRFVYASTRGVHGFTRGGIKINERTPTAPDTAYRRSKLSAEQLLRDHYSRGGLGFVIVRLPSMMGTGAIGWTGLFRAIGGGGFRMIGSGRNRQHPCHIADAIEGLVRAGTTEGVEGECFILGGSEAVSVGEFLESIARALNVQLSPVRLPAAPYQIADGLRRSWARLRGQPVPVDKYEMFLSSYEIDYGKASRELGYTPRHPLAVAIQQTVDWYRANASTARASRS